jgi:hypothetical protein
MLGDAGFEAYAPDFPGHGESAKPSTSSFNYSQQVRWLLLQCSCDAPGLGCEASLISEALHPAPGSRVYLGVLHSDAGLLGCIMCGQLLKGAPHPLEP